jgi:hypothetical protein
MVTCPHHTSSGASISSWVPFRTASVIISISLDVAWNHNLDGRGVLATSSHAEQFIKYGLPTGTGNDPSMERPPKLKAIG